MTTWKMRVRTRNAIIDSIRFFEERVGPAVSVKARWSMVSAFNVSDLVTGSYQVDKVPRGYILISDGQDDTDDVEIDVECGGRHERAACPYQEVIQS